MKKNPGQDKYITTPVFKKLMKEHFTERLKQGNLASKNDIADFEKRIDFDEKLRKNNNKVTSSETKHVEAEKKVSDHITSYAKLIKDLSGKGKLTSTKRLTKDLINGYSILNGAKYFFENESWNIFSVSVSL